MNLKKNELGVDFALEVIATINRIIAFPDAWPLLCPDIKRALMKRYPYGILYSAEKDRMYILAVMNLYKHPEY
ncbi:MAG: hypothetical protein WCH05_04525 [Chlorobiaceae bacterium]